MYNLPYFKESDKTVIFKFIHEHPFAFLAGSDADHLPVATQVPVFIEEENGKIFLRGHIMRQSDHHKAFIQNPNVVVVFTGPHAYVSASWYSDPSQASTWNYMSVHAKGHITFLDEQALVDVLKKTTLHFEGYNPASPTVFDNLPGEYRNRLMKAIVAFRIDVTALENVFKLSQNRDQISYANIIQQLQQQGAGGVELAKEMEERKEKLFPPGENGERKKFMS